MSFRMLEKGEQGWRNEWKSKRIKTRLAPRVGRKVRSEVEGSYWKIVLSSGSRKIVNKTNKNVLKAKQITIIEYKFNKNGGVTVGMKI